MKKAVAARSGSNRFQGGGSVTRPAYGNARSTGDTVLANW